MKLRQITKATPRTTMDRIVYGLKHLINYMAV